MEKSHKCEFGGAHLKISNFHLSINLRNTYIFSKKIYYQITPVYQNLYLNVIVAQTNKQVILGQLLPFYSLPHSSQGKIYMKSVSGSQTLPLFIFDKKMPFLSKVVLF